MPDAWQSAWVEVLPDFKSFKSTANSKMSGILGDAGTAGGITAGRNLQPGILGGIKGLAAPVLGAVAALGIGKLVGDAIGSGIRFGLDGVGLASDLSETRAAIGEVFGDASADIQAYAENANKQLGQTRQSALTAAQTFGVFAKAAGLSGKPLAKFSTDLVGLSGDLASFFNADPSEVIDALGAGLRGEAEPLRRFGVLLDDATLKARALNMGIFDGNGSLSQQQRVLAAQAEIFAQTGLAQGDFARTSDGLANQQRILQASLEDTKTRLGDALLPAFTEAAKFANEHLVPAFEGVVDKVGPKLGKALDDAAPKFKELAEKAGPVLEKFGDFVVSDGIPGLIDTLDQIVDHAPEWIQAFKDLNDPKWGPAQFLNDLADPEKNGSKATHEWLVNLFNGGGGMSEAVKGALAEKTKDAGVTAGQGFADGVASKKSSFFESMSPMARQLDADMQNVMSQAGANATDGLAAGLLSRVHEAEKAARGVGMAAAHALREQLQIHSPSKVMQEIGAFMGEGFALGIEGKTGRVDSATRSLVSLPDISGSLGAVSSSASAESRPAVHMDVHTSPGMSEPTVGRIAADQLNFALREMGS